MKKQTIICDICAKEFPESTGAEIIQRRELPQPSLLVADTVRSVDVCCACLSNLGLPEWEMRDPINRWALGTLSGNLNGRYK